jgi:16S rRNA (guanine(966)-N(2))-methyltransferase RsmD
VISGLARGRKLREPSDSAIRPTGARVKESIFNIIQFDVEGGRVLDLFSGTGQLGIEALSRGASGAVFVDVSDEAVRLTSANLAAAGFSELAAVERRDGLAYIGQCGKHGKFDLIFLDPPYDTALLRESLEKIIEFDILTENGIIVCESRSGAPMPDVPEPYHRRPEYRYGGIKITLYSRMRGSHAPAAEHPASDGK